MEDLLTEWFFNKLQKARLYRKKYILKSREDSFFDNSESSFY